MVKRSYILSSLFFLTVCNVANSTSQRTYIVRDHHFYDEDGRPVHGRMSLKNTFNKDETDLRAMTINGFDYNLNYGIPQEELERYAGKKIVLSSDIKTMIPNTFKNLLCHIKNGKITTYEFSDYHPGDNDWHELTTSLVLNPADGIFVIRPVAANAKPKEGGYEDNQVASVSIRSFSLYFDEMSIKDKRKRFQRKGSFEVQTNTSNPFKEIFSVDQPIVTKDQPVVANMETDARSNRNRSLQNSSIFQIHNDPETPFSSSSGSARKKPKTIDQKIEKMRSMAAELGINQNDLELLLTRKQLASVLEKTKKEEEKYEEYEESEDSSDKSSKGRKLMGTRKPIKSDLDNFDPAPQRKGFSSCLCQ